MADEDRTYEERDGGGGNGGGNIRRWILGISVLLLAIIALQNSQTVAMDFLFVHTKAPLIAALLIAGVLGAIIGYVTSLLRHRHD